MVEFNKKVLDNGLIVLHEKRDVPVSTVMLSARYGSAYEKEEEKGIAHFIEHLCFKGTEKRSVREIASEVENLGGVLNAFTAEEKTGYFVKLPSKHLETAMDVIFDIFFNPIFPEADVERERNVILEEIKMYNDNPRMHTLERLKESLYEKPFGMFAAGTEEGLMNLTRDDLLNRHRQVYVPKNSILCVVGNNDFEEVVRFAEKFCVEREGDIFEVSEIRKRIKRGEEKREGIQQSNFGIGFHFPTANEKGKYAAEVFATILGEGMSSKLFSEVREKRGLAYAVKSSVDCGKNYSYLVIFAGTDKSKVEEARRVCLDEFHKMAGLTEEELEDGKEKTIGNHLVDAESSEQVAMNLIFEEIYGDAGEYYKFAKRIKEVSLEDIKKLAGKTEYSSFVLSP